MSQLEFEGVSKNLRYIFTNKGIHDFVENKSIKYENMSIMDGIKILQEVQMFEYKAGLITLQEHLSNPRRAIISLSEILLPKHSLSILNEWENNYGYKLLLINESSDNLLIEEKIENAWKGIGIILEWGIGDVWDGITGAVGWVGDKLYQGGKYIYDKGVQAWNWIKEKAIAVWNCLTGDFTECLMEGLRSALYSVVGMAVEAFLAVTGVGAPIPMVLWGLMLIWDIYKMFSGKYESGDYEWSWFDIFADILGVGTAGALASVMAAGRATFKGIKTIGGVFSKAKGTGGAIGKAITGIGETIRSIGGGILSALRKAADWISTNLGIKWFSNWIGKAESTVAKIESASIKGTKEVLKKDIKTAKAAIKDPKALAQTGAQTAFNVQLTDFAGKSLAGDVTQSVAPTLTYANPNYNHSRTSQLTQQYIN